MKRFVLSLVVLLILVSASFVQCVGGTCEVPRAPVRKIAVVAVKAPVGILRAVRTKKPARKVVARVATLPRRALHRLFARR
jgi:hypothetical protein